MKKILSGFVAAVLLIGTLLAFSSCDDEKENTPAIENTDGENNNSGNNTENKNEDKNENNNENNNGNNGGNNETIDKSDLFYEDGFDYLKSTLSNYIDFPFDEFKGMSLPINIAKPRDIDVDVAILNLLASNKGAVLNDGAFVSTPVIITPGDVVHIWYNGYLLGENGEKVYTKGMCNFSSSQPASLEIGSGYFVPGFEANLCGWNTGHSPKFVKITEGEIKDTQIAYVSYTRLPEGGISSDKVTGGYVRVDLSDESLDDTYGVGFREAILSATIGEKKSFSVTLDGKTHNYSDAVVNFVTECEENPILVECYFPYDYGSAELRNKTAYFEVYVVNVQEYECPEFNDEYVKSFVNKADSAITEAELLAYEGESYVDKFRAYIESALYKSYEETYKSMVEDAMWDKFLELSVVKKYPGGEVDKIYEEYLKDVDYQFEKTGGSLQNSYTGEYEHFDNVDDFAIAYLGLSYSENKNWKSVLHTMAKNLVKERLIMYYLVRGEGLVPSAEELEEKIEGIKQEYVDEYVNQYLVSQNKTREDFTEEEFAEFVEERKTELFRYYDEAYFAETAYYEIALGEFLTWPEVKTLDDIGDE